jgi:hypothetical protein
MRSFDRAAPAFEVINPDGPTTLRTDFEDRVVLKSISSVGEIPETVACPGITEIYVLKLDGDLDQHFDTLVKQAQDKWLKQIGWRTLFCKNVPFGPASIELDIRTHNRRQVKMENLELSGGDTLHNDTTANEEAKAATSAVVAKLHEVMARLPWGGEYSVKPPVVIGYEVPSELPCISQVQQFHTDFPENGPLSIFIGMQQKVRHLGVASIGGLPAVFAMHRNYLYFVRDKHFAVNVANKPGDGTIDVVGFAYFAKEVE